MPLDLFTTDADNRDKKADHGQNKSKQSRSKSQVTLDELKQARLIAARLVDKYGDTYLPIFREISKRYEKKLQKLQQRDADMASVKAVLKGRKLRKPSVRSSPGREASFQRSARNRAKNMGNHVSSSPLGLSKASTKRSSDSGHHDDADYSDLPLWAALELRD